MKPIKTHDARGVPIILTDEQVVRLAKQLAAKNGGKLPSFTWLTDNGYGCITTRIYKKPELFGDLAKQWRKRKGRGRTPGQSVALAERLANKNHGKIPHPQWLKKHGYTGLLALIYKRPELFAHLKQEKKQ